MSVSVRRKKYIQDLLKVENSVVVSDLAKSLNVSEMTIRRDLKELERLGVLRRTHGGAIKDVSRSYEPPFQLRQHVSVEAKKLIAREALKYVSEGDTIAVDSGTTTLAFANLLLGFNHLTVVTPSLHIATVLLNHPSIKVLLPGGEVRKSEGSLVGSFSRQIFKSLYFDTFFISAAALHEEAGLSDYIIDDAEIKQLVMEHSNKNIALMDSEKFGQTAFAQICSLSEIDTLITDKEPYEALHNELKRCNVITKIAQIGDEK